MQLLIAWPAFADKIKYSKCEGSRSYKNVGLTLIHLKASGLETSCAAANIIDTQPGQLRTAAVCGAKASDGVAICRQRVVVLPLTTDAMQ